MVCEDLPFNGPRTLYPMSDADTTVQWLDRENGQRIAYHCRKGRGPGVVFLGGYASDMTGSKASYLDDWCCRHDRAFLRFDYSGHGQSSGSFSDGTIGSWTQDALAALDSLTEGPQILVGSSMGGWIMLNLALQRPERIFGLIGIAAAPDFSQDLWFKLSPEQQDEVNTSDVIAFDEGGSHYAFTRAFFEDGREKLLLRGPMAIDVPVRLLQGMQDSSVPWETALEISRCMTGEDVVVSLIKDGDHRLSRDEDLACLGATISELLGTAEP